MNRKIFDILLISALISIITVNCFAQTIEKPRLMIFSATWCKPCQSLHEYINNKNHKELDKKLKSFYVTKHDFDKEEDLAKTYKVKSIPTLIIVKDNKEVGRMTGFSMNRLHGFLDKYR